VGLVQKVTLALTLFIIILSGCSAKTGTSLEKSKEALNLDDKTQKYLNNTNTTMEMENTFVLKEYDSSEYILPESDKKKVTTEQLDKLEKIELDFARNEIYARHGYVFKSEKYKNYFLGKSWYKADKDFSESNFSPIEKENLDIINSYVDSLKKLMTEVSNNYIDYDLDNDGNKENITLVFMDNSTKFELTINNTVLSQEGTNFKSTMFIYNIDESDMYTEIAVVDEIEKEVYETKFYRYDGENIIPMGNVSGDEKTIKVTGEGRVITKEKSKILTNLDFIVFYSLKDSQLKKDILKTEIFYEIKVDLLLKEDLTLLNSKDENAETFVMNKESRIDVLKSDELEWIYVHNCEGEGGWIKLTEPNILNGKKFLEVFQKQIY
jgi:hypothetical protein